LINKQDYKRYPLQAGGLLLAEPFGDEKAFQRAAILLADHSDTDGTVGFIINKPIKMPIGAVVKGLGDFQGELFFGGPVQTDTLHYLHCKGDLIENSVSIKDGIFWGGDFDQIRFCIQNDLIQPQDIRFMVGYTGWEVGQLQSELDAGYWWLLEHHPNYLFGTPHDNIWRDALANEDDHLAVIAQMPELILN
jgi:putative transcriptional regulator